jgi:hypothetical protein
MAAFTGSAELTSMEIRMTRRAVLRCLTEHRRDVTTGARNLTVLSQQRILRVSVMVELGNRPDRSPRLGDVAILTRDLQTAVRAPRSLRLLGKDCERSSGCQKRDDRQTEERSQ